MEQLLAEVVFAGNSMVSTNGGTPYHARFGCQPQMLPDLHAPPDDTTVGPGRYMHRVREFALQKIIEGTAVARINRAMRSLTTAPGQTLDYQPDELVDCYRPPNVQDNSGWHGPAKVIRKHTRERSGAAEIQWSRDQLPLS